MNEGTTHDGTTPATLPPAPPEASGRVQRSYNVRFQVDALLRQGSEGPPSLEHAIDVHTHAAPHRENPLSLSQKATEAKMSGVVLKDMAAGYKPGNVATQEVQEALNRWADERQLQPTTCYFGARTDQVNGGLDFDVVRKQVDAGARLIWFPVVSSAYNLYRVGAPKRGIPSDEYPGPMVGPLAWHEALSHGQYMLDDDGRLKQDVRDIMALAADRGIGVSFAHSSKPEMEALAEECLRLNYTQAMIDHPYGPHIGLTFEDLKPFVDAKIWLNFTYDEISPLLGVYPQTMVDAVQALGHEHFTLSSDGGNPLLPAAVDALQTLLNYMRSFGLSAEAITAMTVHNPRRLLGLEPLAA